MAKPASYHHRTRSCRCSLRSSYRSSPSTTLTEFRCLWCWRRNRRSGCLQGVLFCSFLNKCSSLYLLSKDYWTNGEFGNCRNRSPLGVQHRKPLPGPKISRASKNSTLLCAHILRGAPLIYFIAFGWSSGASWSCITSIFQSVAVTFVLSLNMSTDMGIGTTKCIRSVKRKS